MKSLGREVSDRFGDDDKLCTVLYRGTPISRPCGTILDHYVTARQAWLRGEAVNQKTLESLWCEDDLVDDLHSEHIIEIDRALVAESKSARESAKELVSGTDAQSGPMIRTILKEQRAYLLGLDRKFSIEMELFLASTSDSALERVQGSSSSCLHRHAFSLSTRW